MTTSLISDNYLTLYTMSSFKCLIPAKGKGKDGKGKKGKSKSKGKCLVADVTLVDACGIDELPQYSLETKMTPYTEVTRITKDDGHLLP